MNKIKILSLLLCFALLVGILAPGAFALEAKADDTTGDSGTTAEGIEVNKTAAVDEDGNYTITLEAYATGSKVISTVSKDKPTDIVLVLDQSGSMGHCIVCGQEMGGYYDYHYTYKYTEETQISTNNTYYIKNGSSYIEVRYCSGSHRSGRLTQKCEGGPGWYISNQASDHTASAKITPKTDANPNGEQFYTRSGGTWEACTSRLSALKTAVTTFANNVAEKAKGVDGEYGTDDDIQHRIAIVGFGSDDSTNPSYTNTELFIGSTQYNYNSAEISKRYGEAFQRMDLPDGRKNITNSISRLAASGGTAIDLGTNMANKVLEAYKSDADRAKVVIVFTDGVPGIWEDDTDDVRTQYANRAISNTHTSKNTYNATVYTVGVFGGADARNPGALTSSTGWDDNAVANKFMHLMSSNYLNATSMTNAGSLNPKLNGDSYYLSAGDSSALNSIFQKISDQIESGGSSTTLGIETVIKDIVAPAFDMPTDKSDIKVYTAKSNGSTDKWNDRVPFTDGTVTTDTENSTISVSGFSFKDNWCGKETTNNNESFHDGKKLIIEFTVTPKAGFLGGNNVYTNTSAGVYESASAENAVVTFPKPQVNVPIKDVTVTAQDKNVYLLGRLTADQIKSGATVKCGDVTLDLTKADQNYGLERWQTEYVDITVAIKDKDGKAIPADGLNDLTEDTTYTVSVTVTPKKDGAGANGTAATAKNGVNKPPAKINVFKPVLTYKDSEVYYGDVAPENYNSNLTNTEWKHGETVDTSVIMIGTAPPLVITYTTETGKIVDNKINTKQDIAVDVTVKIDTNNVTDYTTFQHTDCTGLQCGNPDNGRFWLHVKTCQLTITKSGGADGEPYVFTIKKDNEKYSEVTIVGNGEATIVELPVGTYSIEEDTGWSWRYTGDNGNGASLTARSPSDTITCTNSNSMPYWLNGYSDVVTNIFGFKH